MTKKQAKIFHFDSFGKRQEKYDRLNNSKFEDVKWQELELKEPYYFFVPKDFDIEDKYNQGFSVSEIFNINSNGIESQKDSIAIQFTKKEMEKIKLDFLELSEPELKLKFNLIDGRDWKVLDAKKDLLNNGGDIIDIIYRPFDFRVTIYSGKSGFIAYPRNKVMGNIVMKDNLILNTTSKNRQLSLGYFFVSNTVSDRHMLDSSADSMSAFPLYLYQQNPLEGKEEKIPNFNMEIIEKIEEKLKMKLNPSKSPQKGDFDKPGYVTADSYSYKYIKETRDELKDNMTKAEEIIWEELKTKKLGFKFRRQHIIDTFIVDFVCLEKKIILEIDGKIHEKQEEKDFFRTQRLNELGFKVIRFKNEEIFSNLNQVIKNIKSELDNYSPPLEGLGEVFEGSFSPEDLFDYIYAVLHSKTYRETYKEFLKIDFPKIPFDCDKEIFFKLVELGRELRTYHLMENENLIPKNFITKYEIDGDNLVEKINFKKDSETSSGGQKGKVFINDSQYFSGVPLEVWEFYIGGYQPAQKWLKDRKGRKLSYEDILHYSKIILCLQETIRIMSEIEKICKNDKSEVEKMILEN